MMHLTAGQWALAIVAAVGVGVSKAGFPGVGLAHVVIFAFLFGARTSSGIVLPMLLIGDLCAVGTFRQHAQWHEIRRILPPACLGVTIAALVMSRLTDASLGPVVGWIILGLALVQIARMRFPSWLTRVPHTRVFAWTIGWLAGVATMLANAAGPVFALFGLAVSLPKAAFVGTAAWFFLIMNCVKIPFSVSLGLIRGETLLLNLMLAPAIVTGLIIGRWLLHRVPQQLFDGLLIAFASIAAIRLIGVFQWRF
jgi:uncharacterized membrane protein YfcA